MSVIATSVETGSSLLLIGTVVLFGYTLARITYLTIRALITYRRLQAVVREYYSEEFKKLTEEAEKTDE
jgi:hypothetical protein